MALWFLRCLLALVACLVLLLVSPSVGYDANFACCGGCSSYKRSDGYEKLVTGSHIFIWDLKVKTTPSESCLKSFPYDPGQGEQPGDRRVRSGQLVGTNYPPDHDYDELCCDRSGSCQLREDDASGKCQCVKRWRFSGNHCELSIYDVARTNNSVKFPAIANLSDVKLQLPDFRAKVIPFDIVEEIDKSRTQDPSETASLNAFDNISFKDYRAFAWVNVMVSVAVALVILFFFMLHLVWTICCFKCRCRKKDPTKEERIYSKAQKIFFGSCMVFCFCVGACASVLAFLHVSDLVSLSDSVLWTLSVSIPSGFTNFREQLLTPLQQVNAGYKAQISIRSLQQTIQTKMPAHTYFKLNKDAGIPLFTVLDPLRNLSARYPLADTGVDCTSLGIKASVASRMTVGADTGCYECKQCAEITSLLAAAKDSWKRNAHRFQQQFVVAQQQLMDFASASNLQSSTFSFVLQINQSIAEFLNFQKHRVVPIYTQHRNELKLIGEYGTYSLMGFAGVSALTSWVAITHGVITNKRHTARTTSTFGHFALYLALIMTGVLATTALMVNDSLLIMQLFEHNTTIFMANLSTSDDVSRVLLDQNLVESNLYDETFAFADTLRVPPLPTPENDDPPRLDMKYLYEFPDFTALQATCKAEASALSTLFSWDEDFLNAQHSALVALITANDSVLSPYNGTDRIYLQIMNTTIARLLDPDQDGKNLTPKDSDYVHQTFNVTWKKVSDDGAHQNDLIFSQWLFTANIHKRKIQLANYVSTIYTTIDKIHPIFEELKAKTLAIEQDEFDVKLPVEFFTNSIQASKIQDCSFDSNCAWFRTAFNELFDLLHQMLSKSQKGTLFALISAVSSLLGVLFSMCFAHRLRRKVVKVYVAN